MWLLLRTAAILVRPPEGRWEGGVFVMGGEGRGDAGFVALFALLAGWPVLASTETLTLGPLDDGTRDPVGLYLGLLLGWVGWFFGFLTLLQHGAALLVRKDPYCEVLQ